MYLSCAFDLFFIIYIGISAAFCIRKYFLQITFLGPKAKIVCHSVKAQKALMKPIFAVECSFSKIRLISSANKQLLRYAFDNQDSDNSYSQLLNTL